MPLVKPPKGIRHHSGALLSRHQAGRDDHERVRREIETRPQRPLIPWRRKREGMVDVRNLRPRTCFQHALPNRVTVDHDPQAQIRDAAAKGPAIERQGLLATAHGVCAHLPDLSVGVGQLANVASEITLSQRTFHQEVMQDVVVEDRHPGIPP
jgi:hypothetical protein